MDTKTLAVQRGMDDARADLARCSDESDVRWYRQIVADNHVNGTPRDRWYLAGYDYVMQGGE